jgi:hypothetical protein
MMEAVMTSETSVNLYQFTRRYKPKDSHLLLRTLQEVTHQNVLLTSKEDV